MKLEIQDSLAKKEVKRELGKCGDLQTIVIAAVSVMRGGTRGMEEKELQSARPWR